MSAELCSIGRLNQVAALSLGATLMALSITLAWVYSQQTANRQFSIEASKLHDHIVHKIAAAEAALDGLSSLFAAVPYADAEGFRVVSEQFLDKFSYLRSVAYFKYIESANRQSFEHDMEALGFAGFHIKQNADNRNLKIAKLRKQYLPLMYIEPFTVRHLMMLGLDVYAEHDLQQTLGIAIAKNTRRGNLTSGILQPLGQFWLFMPLYAGKAEKNQNKSINDLLGVVVVAIDLSSMLHDINLSAGMQIAFVKKLDPESTISSIGQSNRQAGFYFEQALGLAGESHPFLLSISKNLIFGKIPKAPFIFAFSASLFITLLLIFVANSHASRNRALISRNREISQQVALQTRDLEKAQGDLEESYALLHGTLESTDDGILVVNSAGKILHYNQRFMTMWKLTDQLQIADKLENILPKMLQQLEQENDFLLRIKGLNIASNNNDSNQVTFADGRVFQYFSQAHQVAVRHLGQVWSFHDVTNFLAVQRALEEKEVYLDHLAKHDSLTTLPNRLFFLERLDNVVQSAELDNKLLAVMFVDLDGFKPINDSLGHDVGDKVLRCVADRLKEVSGINICVARLGGDEFTILLNNIKDQNDIEVLAERLQNNIEQPIHVSGYELFVTVSVGISIYPQDGDTAENLLRNADAAMYSAKKAGRNTTRFYTTDMTETTLQHLRLKNRLHGALEREEFYLEYQPERDLKSGQMVGAEALLRWRDSEQGELSPLSFIPLAEKTGLILPIGEWVIRKACEQWVSWRDAGIKLDSIAVNLSVRQLQQESLYDIVVSTLEETGCPAQHLELEINENFVIHRADHSLEALKRFRKLGIDIALDDFGTGHASLNHLRHLSISKLKIDRSFIRDVPGNKDDEAIVQSIVALGKVLKMTTIAEGIETMEQESFIAKIGCAQGQGFLYGRPMSAEKLFMLMSDNIPGSS